MCALCRPKNNKDVWLTLTDYDRLAEYVPNLTQSKLRPSNDGGIRLWQEGAQKIVGFDFRASVEMFMDEHFGEPQSTSQSESLQPGGFPPIQELPLFQSSRLP